MQKNCITCNFHQVLKSQIYIKDEKYKSLIQFLDHGDVNLHLYIDVCVFVSMLDCVQYTPTWLIFCLLNLMTGPKTEISSFKQSKPYLCMYITMLEIEKYPNLFILCCYSKTKMIS